MIDRNPRYDRRQVFKPDLTKLLPGDIILTRNTESTSFKGKAQSDAIASATGGSFSHALLCTVPPTLIEAIGDGVSNLSAQISFAHDLKNVRVLRYHDQKIAKEAGSAALRFMGQKYSVRDAIRSIFPGVQIVDPKNDQTFCSALVATAFKAAGAPEFATVDPMKTTPAALEKIENFTDVTSKVFQKILAPKNIEAMNALDGDRITSPMAEQTKIFNEYYSKISPLIKEFIDQHSDLVDRRPTTFLDCLVFIVNSFKACEKFLPGVKIPERQLSRSRYD